MLQYEPPLETGLTPEEVQQRVAAGQQNDPLPPLTRSIKQIFRDNLVTLFNLINVLLGALVLVTGSYKNLLFLGVVVVNTAIGIFQEIRSKRQVDKLALLSESKSRIRRAGKIVVHPQEDIVQDDILEIGRGDQLPVDALIRQTTGLEVDESQITGESTPIIKVTGENLTSGSVILAGRAAVQATTVGHGSFVKQLAHSAKQQRRTASQLLTIINRIIKALTFAIIPLGVALFVSSMMRGQDLNRAILGTVASMVGMIPEGLVLLTSVALAAGAFTLGRRHVLVRELPAIEALARVDVLCLDKTGTITSGQLQLDRVEPWAETNLETTQTILAQLVAATSDDNETAQAIQQALGTPTVTATTVLPFSSGRKWSGAIWDKQAYVMGAPEFIFDQVPAGLQARIHTLAGQGYRVLVLAAAKALTTPRPTAPRALGLILITDELRPRAKDTFSFFANQDVALKVISGDNPVTVASIAQRAEIAGAERLVDMSQVGETPDYGQLVRDYTVFGRVTPQQKEQLIKAYQAAGHTVAMTGDGVNDLLALRQADCSIAMASGSEATKSLADFVLVDSNFDAMINVLNEGRRVINNVERVASLFLIKTMYSVVLTLIFIFMSRSYPFEPIQLTPISSLMVGIPTFFLALQPNYARIADRFMKQVMEIAAPAAVCVVGYILVVMALGTQFQLSFATTSTLSVLMTGLISLNALLMVARPLNRFKIGLVVAMAALFAIIFLFFGPIFSLVNLLNWRLALIYLPLMVSVEPIFLLVQDILGRRILSRIRWR
ncbi:cation-translocating P-type ATPase [Levilactobacillus brevis]|jgi:cation-transporting ATPase E|uniref:Cation transport ATPase n=1 Tax=Levilactobacillus brevis (strain ATCC 367 / BCRC 12310 / CIP 105137 / JCM 1170 / LMG 11437 / NCIMB 947 / NCTC 947) TaxID=387344 RepID=Q03U35_LEVBA|nr:cation-translocating P-type ATPase [Levilactobacillus brevis]MBL3536161.1 HAD-IC family P-type ATPase [Lactobacillus sp. GPR40-2]MBL3629051.1 HAD-IC family P-type ATPase [Lactobacillus sp. GPB7-4]MBT1152776.1 HAD-IC family P-type ATPase [Lactiplantibacillus argentoratensis]ABJ63287.1 Cation transport ATPase [Levilactobacillus brevis ATCC 367]ARQ93036.1 magnesium-transporting ATPase [Levilactobacillus brevis]